MTPKRTPGESVGVAVAADILVLPVGREAEAQLIRGTRDQPVARPVLGASRLLL